MFIIDEMGREREHAQRKGLQTHIRKIIPDITSLF
jgi:hypothetical protein